jgi:hypothetical protein
MASITNSSESAPDDPDSSEEDEVPEDALDDTLSELSLRATGKLIVDSTVCTTSRRVSRREGVEETPATSQSPPDTPTHLSQGGRRDAPTQNGKNGREEASGRKEEQRTYNIISLFHEHIFT